MKRNQKAWLLTWEWIGDHAAVEDRTAGILRPRLSKEVGGEIVETIYAVHEGYVGELACWSRRPKEKPFKAGERRGVSPCKWGQTYTACCPNDRPNNLKLALTS